MTLENWETYILGLCTKHKAISLSTGTRAFIPFAAGETAANNSKLKKIYVVHDFFSGFQKNSTQWQFNSEIMVLMNAPATGNLTDNINTIRNTTMQVVADFSSAIEKDYEQGDPCLDFEDMYVSVMEPVGMEDINAFGWKITVQITIPKPEYNANQWA